MNPLYPLRATVNRLRRRPHVNPSAFHETAATASAFRFVSPAAIRPQTSMIRGTQPHLSIVLVSRQRSEQTLRCLASVVANAPGCEYEVLVAQQAEDGASTDRVAEVPGVHHFDAPAPLDEVATCNVLCRQARGAFLLLLEPEVELLPGAVDALLSMAERDPVFGIVCGRVLGADGRLASAGGVVEAGTRERLEGEGDDPAASAYRYVRDADFAPRGALLVRRSVWEHLDGWDPGMGDAVDVDLALRAQALGLRVMYEPLAVALRHGPLRRPAALPAAFASRWADHPWLAVSQGELEGAEPTRPGGRPIVLFVDRQLPLPGRARFAAATLSLLEMFQRLGHEAKFVATDPQSRHDAEPLERRGIECLLVHEDGGFPGWLSHHGPAVAAAVVLDPQACAFTMPQLRQAGVARIVYFGHELQFARLAARQQRLGDPSIGDEVLRTFDRERRAWTEADVVVCTTQADAARVRELTPQAHVQVLAVPPFKAGPERTSAPVGATVLCVADAEGRATDPAPSRQWLHDVLAQVPQASVRWHEVDVMDETEPTMLAASFDRALEGVRVVLAATADSEAAKAALRHGIPVLAALAPDAERAEAPGAEAATGAAQLARLLDDDGHWLAVSRRQVADAAQRWSMPALLSAVANLVGDDRTDDLTDETQARRGTVTPAAKANWT